MRHLLILWSLVAVTGIAADESKPASRLAEIEAFNTKFVDAHRKTDQAAILAMWSEDGVDLMPGQDPLVGKPAIAAWLNDILSKMPDAKVTTEEVNFHDIRVSGDWASEWATEHQVVKAGAGETVEGYGKLALILERESNGQWKLKQEMWNNSPETRG